MGEKKRFDVLVNAAGLADLFGITRASVSAWWSLPGAPDPVVPGTRPRGSLAAGVAWRLDRRPDPGDCDLRDELDRARLELTKVRGEREQLKLERETSESVSREKWTADLQEVGGIFCGALDRLGAEVCSSLVGRTARDIRNVLDAWGVGIKRELRERSESPAAADEGGQ